jgi:hypothetical protein
VEVAGRVAEDRPGLVLDPCHVRCRSAQFPGYPVCESAFSEPLADLAFLRFAITRQPRALGVRPMPAQRRPFRACGNQGLTELASLATAEQVYSAQREFD